MRVFNGKHALRVSILQGFDCKIGTVKGNHYGTNKGIFAQIMRTDVSGRYGDIGGIGGSTCLKFVCGF